uniref:hypothetical protein n=1 Tax=Streptococcus pluranimalium TaxID=82348 RepID=UPI003F690BD9
MNKLVRRSVFFYKQKNLAAIRWLRSLIVVTFGIGVSFGLYASFMELISIMGMQVVSLLVLPYVMVGLLVILFCSFSQKKQVIPWLILLFFFPLFVLTPSGVASLTFYAVILMVTWIERSQRVKAIELVSFYSEKYSPLYDQRHQTRNKDTEARFAYQVLPLINIDDYALVSETKVTTNHKISGLSETYLLRTFSVKGLPDTVIKDPLTIHKMSKWKQFTLLQLPLLKRR